MLQSSERVTELYRAACTSALDMMNLCVGGVARLHDYQAGAIEEMRSGHREISKQIGSVRTLQELQAAQAELARSQMTRMASYWSGLLATGWKDQVEMLNEAQVKGREATEAIGRKFEAARPGNDKTKRAA